MFLKIYNNILEVSKTKYAPIVLSMVAFWESIVFPIPPDVILIPMSLAQRTRALFFAGLTTIFSVFGATIGYLLGLVLWTELGEPLTFSLGYGDSYSDFTTLYDEYGILIIIIGAFTPFPFKVIAILSGAMKFSFLSFLIAAFLSRGLRFYTISSIIFFWGKQIDHFIKKYLGLLFVGITLVLIGAHLFFYDYF